MTAVQPPPAPAPARASVPLRPARDLRLDVMRGLMQVFIFVSHVPGTVFGWAIHGSWGFSDSSEQFVFLSGFTLGSVFALKWARAGYGAAMADMAGRTLNLYRTHLLTFALFTAAVLWACSALPLPDEALDNGFGYLLEAPGPALVGIVAMLYQPAFMGILPVFVWCMLLLPPFLALAGRVGAWALLPCALLYLAVQLWDIGLPPIPAEGGIAFDPLAWQMIFLLGVWFGREALWGRPIGRRRWLVALAATYVAFSFVVRLSWIAADLQIWPGFQPPLTDGALVMAKETLSPFRLVHALALAYLVGALVPREARAWHTGWGVALGRCGRYSLQVFCFGLFLSYGGGLLMRLHPRGGLLLDATVIAAGIALLVAFATLKERAADRRRARALPLAA